MSAELLAPNVGHYVFISTISVYKRRRSSRTRPRTRTLRDDGGSDERGAGTGQTYGALKALSEKAAEAAMPGRVLALRPGPDRRARRRRPAASRTG